MAISAPHYRCLRELHRRGELPQGGSILEIGEANWYGDMPIGEVCWDSRSTRHHGETMLHIRRAVDVTESHHGQVEWKHPWGAFDFVKAVYGMFFGPLVEVTSVDIGGGTTALKLDLNSPMDLGRNFGTVYNHGTAEHIFNVAQVFRTMHDHCAVGGLMIHESPFTGWVDHGFWNIQPTVYFDLCAANGYKLVYMAVTQIEHNSATPIESREQLLQMARTGGIPQNAMLYVAMRKQEEAEFKIPMQGVYAGTLSEEAKQAWSQLR